MTQDETRALRALSLILALAAGARIVHATRSEAPIETDLPRLDAESLEIATKQAEALEQRRNTPLAANEKIRINTASPDELQRLPRVGPSLAGRIVAARDSLGGFRSAEVLGGVRGVGPRMLAALEPHLDFSAAPGRPPPPSPMTGTAPADPVDLNTATGEELEKLPGVGPALAARIIAYRDSAGRFSSLEEVSRVRGVGPRLLARWAGLARLAP